jgi:hypothetical protein
VEGTIDKTHQVIQLHLERAQDMFEMPQTDLFSEFRNFLTGIEFCVSELRSHNSRKPVRIEIELPRSEVTDDIEERIARTLRRYCAHRTAYSSRERRAVRFDGLTALRIGLPLTAVGLALTVTATVMDTPEEVYKTVIDHLGWVLAWIGLWYPLDTLCFYGHPYTRELRALHLLHDAQIVVVADDRADTLLL